MKHETFNDFWKASHKHLRDARELLQPPTLDSEAAGSASRHLRGACYLGGYGVECVYKAYLIAMVCDLSQPGAATLTQASLLHRSRGNEVPDLFSARGHNLTLLYGLTDLDLKLPTDPTFRQTLGMSQKWTHLMRYDPSVPKAEDVLRYIEAARSVHARVASLIGT